MQLPQKHGPFRVRDFFEKNSFSGNPHFSGCQRGVFFICGAPADMWAGGTIAVPFLHYVTAASLCCSVQLHRVGDAGVIVIVRRHESSVHAASSRVARIKRVVHQVLNAAPPCPPLPPKLVGRTTSNRPIYLLFALHLAEPFVASPTLRMRLGRQNAERGGGGEAVAATGG